MQKKCLRSEQESKKIRKFVAVTNHFNHKTMRTKAIMTGILGSIFGLFTACGQNATMPEGKLLSLEYTESGTMAGYTFEGSVTTMKDGRVRLRVSYNRYGPLVKKIVDAKVLDDLRQIIKEEKMYAYKSHYQPMMEVLDGWGWSFHASFENEQSISSGGSNARPPGNGLGRIESYLTSLIGDSRPTGWLDEDQEPSLQGTTWTDGLSMFTFVTPDSIAPVGKGIGVPDCLDNNFPKNNWRIVRLTAKGQDILSCDKNYSGSPVAFQRCENKPASRQQLWQKSLRMLVAGTYTGTKLKKYIFTPDGLYKSGRGDKGIAYEFLSSPAPKAGIATPPVNVLKAGPHRWMICLTDSGLNLYEAKTVGNQFKRGKLLDTLVFTDNGTNEPGRWPLFSMLVANKWLLNLVPPKVLRYISNEIKARHGYAFYNDKEAENYFNQQSWYEQNYSHEAFSPVEEINSNAIYNLLQSEPKGPWPWFESE